MTPDEVRKTVLTTMETSLELQLRAVRQMLEKDPTPPPIRRRGGRRRQSLVDLSVQILTERAGPMHVNDIVEALRKSHGRVTDRDAISSALGKKAAQGLLVRKAGRATFEALNQEEQP